MLAMSVFGKATFSKVCQPGYRPKGFSFLRFAVGEASRSNVLKKSSIWLAMALSSSAAPFFTIDAKAQSAMNNDGIATVNVTSKRGIRPTLDVLADTTIIDRAAIASSPALTLVDLLQEQAGLEITLQGGQGKLSGIFLRGTKTAQTLIIVDGVRLENPLSGGANLEFIPLAAIERIEVSRGPASSFYGSAAMGGVIQIFTRQNSDGTSSGIKTFGSFAYGSNATLKANAGVSGADQSTRWLVSIARDQTKGFEATLPSSSSYQADRDGNRQSAVNLSASHQFSPRFSAGVNAFVTNGRSFYDSMFSAPADTRLDFRTSALSGFVKGLVNNVWATELRVGKSAIGYDYFDATGLFPFAPKSDTLNFAWTNQIKLSEQPSAGSVFAGLESAKQSVTGPGVSTGSSVYGATSRRISSLFGGYETRFDSHSIRMQLRNDSIQAAGAALSSKATTGTVAYGYGFNNGWQLRASVGSAFRAPTFDDLYNPFGPNPLLKPEKSVGYEIGTEYRQSGQSAQTLKLTAFSQKIRQAIELDSSFVSQNYDAAKVSGATVEASQQFGAFRLKGHLTLQDTQGTYTDFTSFLPVTGPLARRANVHGSIALNWQANDVNSMSKTGLRGAIQWQFQGHRIDTDGARLAGYGVLNLTSSYRFSDAQNSGWSVFGKLGNALGREYQLASGYRATPRYLMIGISYE
jgi:vitamin B12 transporter